MRAESTAVRSKARADSRTPLALILGFAGILAAILHHA